MDSCSLNWAFFALSVRWAQLTLSDLKFVQVVRGLPWLKALLFEHDFVKCGIWINGMVNFSSLWSLIYTRTFRAWDIVSLLVDCRYSISITRSSYYHRRQHGSLLCAIRLFDCVVLLMHSYQILLLLERSAHCNSSAIYSSELHKKSSRNNMYNIRTRFPVYFIELAI